MGARVQKVMDSGAVVWFEDLGEPDGCVVLGGITALRLEPRA